MGQGAPLGDGRKRGASANAIGRSRGGPTTKLHALVDGLGRLVAFLLTPGQRGDAPVAADLIQAVPASVTLSADRAYDSDALRGQLIARGTRPVIPNAPYRKRLHPFDPDAYKRRNLVERAFCRLKDFRRVATRYDRLACTYAAAVALAAIVAWWL
jgi:transposase